MAAPKLSEKMMKKLTGENLDGSVFDRQYRNMEKDQLILMIHILVKRKEERVQENQKLKGYG